MKKIALFLFSDYTKSWLDSGILGELSGKCDLIVYGHQNVIAKINERAPLIRTLEIPDFKNSRSTQRLQLVSLITRRSKSTSFNFRLGRLIFGDLRLVQEKKTLARVARASIYSLRRFVRFAFSNPIEMFAFISPLGKLVESLLRRQFRNVSSQKFLKLALEEDIDLALIPSAAIEDRVYEFVEFLKTSSITSAICIENWDNLTSKSILISIPDYVLVMGAYCKEHGIRIQEIKGEQIIVAGLPRFNPYRSVVLSGKHHSRTESGAFRILYLGFSVPHNEKNLIGAMISLLDSSELKDKYEFNYKPHPARQMRFYESKTVPTKVRIIESDSNVSGFSALPSISPEHIQNILDSNVVISTPTSMAIESMLLRVPTIIDATDDGVHKTSAACSLTEYLHLRDLTKLEGISIGRSASELVELIIREFYNQGSYSGPVLENLIESTRASYASHITDLANRL